MVATNQAPLVPMGMRPPSCSAGLLDKPLWLSVLLLGLTLSGCQESLIVRRTAGIRLNAVDATV
jgi:hypothetical protein